MLHPKKPNRIRALVRGGIAVEDVADGLVEMALAMLGSGDEGEGAAAPALGWRGVGGQDGWEGEIVGRRGAKGVGEPAGQEVWQVGRGGRGVGRAGPGDGDGLGGGDVVVLVLVLAAEKLAALARRLARGRRAVRLGRRRSGRGAAQAGDARGESWIGYGLGAVAVRLLLEESGQFGVGIG